MVVSHDIYSRRSSSGRKSERLCHRLRRGRPRGSLVNCNRTEYAWTFQAGSLAGIAGILLTYLPSQLRAGWPSGFWPFAALGALEWLIPGILIGLFVGAVTSVNRDRK
jgi:hypothetical protein